MEIIRRGLERRMTQRKAAVVLYGTAIFICVLALGTTALHSNRVAMLMIGMVLVLHVAVRQVAQVELYTTPQQEMKGIHSPRNVVSMLVAICWDISCLLLATYVVFAMVLLQTFSLWQVGLCVTIPFATIYFYNIYKTVWTRSRAAQVFVLVLQLAAGEVLAYVALLWATTLTSLELLMALVLHSLIAGIGIVGGRASLRVVRDLSAWMRGTATSGQDIKTLILGAGENAILYLRQASFEALLMRVDASPASLS